MSSFTELLQIYSWSLPASIVMAIVLALIGAQWIAREKSSQIFVLGQASSLGIVLGLTFNLLWQHDVHFLNLFSGLILGVLTLLFSEKWVESKSDRHHIYLTLFVLFMALTYLITAVTPSLETHMAAAYFGDLAVMSTAGAQFSLTLGALLLALLLWKWRELTQKSFKIVNRSLVAKNRWDFFFDFSSLLVSTVAIQNMGYLFSMGSLFIGTSFASRVSRNLKDFTLRVIFIAGTGTALGFCLSLLSTSLPTVPCILLTQICVGFLSYMKK